MPTESERVALRAQRLVEWFARLTGRSGRRSEGVERLLLVIAVVIFVAATLIAWQRLPAVERGLDVRWMSAVAVLAVLALATNAMEFAVSARLLGRRVAASEALRVSVLGSAANVLPIPGAVVMRTRALRQLGEGGRSALTVTTAVGVVWVAAAAFLAGGLLLLSREHLRLSILVLLLALVAVLVAAVFIRLAGGTFGRSVIIALASVELVSVLGSGVRLYGVAQATGFDVGLVEAVTINLGAILSHAAGLVPAGLGLRELGSGILAELAGVPASVGVVLSVLDRFAIYLVLSFAVLVFIIVDRPHPGRPESRSGNG